MAHVTKSYTSRKQRGLTPLVSVSKRVKKMNKQNKDLFKSMFASAEYKRENQKDRKLVKKWQIERILTNLAASTYKTYGGKVEWSKIVQSIKTDRALTITSSSNDKNHQIDYSKIGEVKIKTNEIEKYAKYLAER